MRAGPIWVALVGIGVLIPVGFGSAAECNGLERSLGSVMFVMDSPAPSPAPPVELNVSVEAPNSTTFVMAGNLGVTRICFTPDSVPTAATVASLPRPPPEPNWPEVTSLTTDFLSSSAVKVNWTTNVPTVGRVVWGPSGHGPTGTAASDVFATEHAVWIRGLTPGETYVVHIIAFDGRASAELSDTIVVMTPLPPRDIWADALLVAASVAATVGICDLKRRKKA